MRGFISTIGALALAFSSIPTSYAATVISTGTYGAGDDAPIHGSIDIGPGKYRFQIDLTTPALDVFADVWKSINYNEYCDFQDGQGVVYCGGDDTPQYSHFTQIGPTRWIADMTVDPFTSTPSEGVVVRIEQFDLCCDYAGDIYADAAGSYTLSLTSVPEPATWAIMLLGVGAAGSVLRRQRGARVRSA